MAAFKASRPFYQDRNRDEISLGGARTCRRLKP